MDKTPKETLLRRTIDEEKTAIPDRGDNTPISELADSYLLAGLEERGEWLNATREIARESYLLNRDQWVAFVAFIELAKISVDNLFPAFESALRRWPFATNSERLAWVASWLAGNDIKIPTEVINLRSFSKLKEHRWTWIDVIALHDLRQCKEIVGKLLAKPDKYTIGSLMIRLDQWRRDGKDKEVRELCQHLLRMKPAPPKLMSKILRDTVRSL